MQFYDVVVAGAFVPFRRTVLVLLAIDEYREIHFILLIFFNFSNVCPFDCANVAESGKVGPLNLRVTTLVG